MIKCKRHKVVFKGTPLILLAEFSVIADLLRDALTKELDEETVQEAMDSAYNYKREGKTC